MKVVDLKAPENINNKRKKLTKQNIVIGDGTAACRLVLWDKNDNRLSLNTSYKITDVCVKKYDNLKYLGLSADTEITEIDDLGDVNTQIHDTTITSTNQSTRVIEGEIDSVRYEEYLNCKLCNSKMINISDTWAECSKCSSKSKIKTCEQASVAKIIVTDSAGYEHNLTMFMETLARLADLTCTESTIEEQLLTCGRALPFCQ